VKDTGRHDVGARAGHRGQYTGRQDKSRQDTGGHDAVEEKIRG
jgi:hypothetical protein